MMPIEECYMDQAKNYILLIKSIVIYLLVTAFYENSREVNQNKEKV